MKYYLLLILVALPSIAMAQEVYTFNQSIPFLNGDLDTANLASALFNMAIIIAAILVVIRLIWAGTQYMLSGLVTKKESAKEEIKNALIGLLIILGSVTILQTINPQLLNLNALAKLEPVQLQGLESGPNGEFVNGNFTIGDKVLVFTVSSFCKRRPTYDELCESKTSTELAQKCSASGGVMEKKLGGGGFAYYCE